jgi:hypothetical protein
LVRKSLARRYCTNFYLIFVLISRTDGLVALKTTPFRCRQIHQKTRMNVVHRSHLDPGGKVSEDHH